MTDILDMKRHQSPLSNPELLRKAIEQSTSSREILSFLGLRAAGGNYAMLKKYAEYFGYDLPKPNFITSFVGREIRPQLSNEVVFVKNSTYSNRTSLKKRLYKLGFKEECSECGTGNEWNGKPITLQLDHINGIHDDNRLENLRIICPNCHSQTETFAGRTKGPVKTKAERKAVRKQKRRQKQIEVSSFCIDCNEPVDKAAKRCLICAPKARYGTQYPEIETLVDELASKSFVQVAKEIGVSDNALRKHMKKSLGAEHPLFHKKKRSV